MDGLRRSGDGSGAAARLDILTVSRPDGRALSNLSSAVVCAARSSRSRALDHLTRSLSLEASPSSLLSHQLLRAGLASLGGLHLLAAALEEPRSSQPAQPPHCCSEGDTSEGSHAIARGFASRFLFRPDGRLSRCSRLMRSTVSGAESSLAPT